MKILTLILHLVRFYLKYGNCEIDTVIEFENEGQWEAPVGSLAYSPRQKRVKLLSEGFT